MSGIRPFRIEATETELEDLRRRLLATRWPEPETVDDWSQGVPLSYLKDVIDYWARDYDWRSREAQLNRFPQYKTRLVLREAIELRLARTPVVISCPIVDDILQIAQRHALRPIIDRFRLRPSRGEQTPPEILELGLRCFNSKRPDAAHGSVPDCLEYRQRVRQRFALYLQDVPMLDHAT